MGYLTGKCLQATKSIRLVKFLVDGEVISASDFYIPELKQGDKYFVVQDDDDLIILRNLNSDDWLECEIPVEYIEDFKVISKSGV